MALFAITYEISYDNDARYQRCYAQLNAAIKAQARYKYWNETTSFYLIENDGTSASVADAIVAATDDWEGTKDLLVVINISLNKGHAVRGALRDTDFNVLMGSRSS